ncbi:Protein of unknown function, partial [Gryllus bimaculatus]
MFLISILLVNCAYYPLRYLSVPSAPTQQLMKCDETSPHSHSEQRRSTVRGSLDVVVSAAERQCCSHAALRQLSRLAHDAKTKKPDVAGDAVVRDEVDKDAKRHRAKKKHRSHEKERTHDKAKEKGAAEEKGEATATAKVADGDDDPRPRPGHVELYVNEEVDA